MSNTDDDADSDLSVRFPDSAKLDFQKIPIFVNDSSDGLAHYLKCNGCCSWCNQCLPDGALQCAQCYARLHAACLRRAMELQYPCPGCRQRISGDPKLIY